MNTNFKSKVILISILFSLMWSLALLWPNLALADGPYCSNPNLPIPDSPNRDVPGTPATDTITINDTAILSDLNIVISTTHDYVGDLVFTLSHQVDSSITSTTMISRPLRGQSVLPHEVACSGDDIFVTLDDEAGLDIQIDCAEGFSEGDGTQAYITGQSYRPYSPLSIFDSDTISGTWTLTVTDNYIFDDGTLNGWCLIPNSMGDLRIFKAVTPKHPIQGQPITYTITYNNSSATQTASGVVITDTIPSYLTNLAVSSDGAAIAPTPGITYAWTVSNLAPGEGGVITITGNLASDVAGGTNFINTAIITGTSVETNTTDNQSSVNVIVQPPNLQLSKNDGSLTAIPGDLITYTLTYANIGGNATGVIITEILPDNTSFNSAASTPGWQQVGATNQYTYNVGALNGGVTQNITFVVTVSNPLPAGVTTIANTAQINDDGNNGTDLYPGDNSTNITTSVAAVPDLSLSKTDGNITVTPGETITYTLTYTNLGNQDATGVVITETVPANTTFNAAASQPTTWNCANGGAAGSTCTTLIPGTVVGRNGGGNITFAVSVTDPLPVGVDVITNTAQIGDDGTNGNDPSDNNSDMDTTPIIMAPDLFITKGDSGLTATPGNSLTYTLTYTNNGGRATGVVVSETLPANTSFNNTASTPGWQQVGASNQYTYSIGSLNAGVSQSVTFGVTLNNPLPVGVTSITNTAQIGDDGNNGADQNLNNNSTTKVTPVSAAPDLTITKTDGNIIATRGGAITYTLTFSNIGSQNASGVVITETLPTNTSFNAASTPGWQQVGATSQYIYNVGILNVGPSQSIIFVVTVNDPLPLDVNTISNTVRIGGGQNDQNPINNVYNRVTTVDNPLKVFLPIIQKND